MMGMIFAETLTPIPTDNTKWLDKYSNQLPANSWKSLFHLDFLRGL